MSFSVPIGKIAGFVGGSLAIYLSIPFLKRAILRRLLRRTGWIHDQRSKASKLHVGLVALLVGNDPRGHSLEDVLPPLPLPTLHDSLQRYVASVKGLLDDEAYERTVAAVVDFENTVGPSLQKVLEVRAGKEISWLAKTWSEQTYLRNRAPLPTASMWYATDQRITEKENNAARAARVTRALIEFFVMMRDGELPATTAPVPLCMDQYRKLFSVTRVPGKEVDEVVSYTPDLSRHIIVSRKGQFYIVPAFHSGGNPLATDEIFKQFDFIVKDADKAEHHMPFGALTSTRRDQWAANRQHLMDLSADNKYSVMVIESAMFCVALEEGTPSTPEELGRLVWFGNGHNRWFDKSFTLVVSDDGQAGISAEHSSVDAMVMAHLFDYVFSMEFGEQIDYTVARPVISPPKRLRVTADDLLKEEVVAASAAAGKTFASLDICALDFKAFGKAFIRQCTLSPDAFVQMAIQLAYYRTTGSHTLTYETAHTRLFRQGRTDTVQSCTAASVAFVEAMCDPACTREDRFPLLRRAIDAHLTQTRDVMIGRGCWRHMFALSHVARDKGVKAAIFTDAAFTMPYRLVTAQTTAQRIHGGGFAPHEQDGYGVSYLVADSHLTFHVICYKNDKTGDRAARFCKNLESSLRDIQASCFDKKLKKFASIADLNEIAGPGWIEKV